MSKKEQLMAARGFFIALFYFFACCAVTVAAPISVPPSATPGAVEPGRMKPPPKREDEYYLFDLIPSPDKAPKGDEGEKTYVRSIILQGVVDHPKAKLYLRDVREIVQKYSSLPRAAVVRAGQQDPNVVMLDSHLTLGQLVTIAGDITKYYRKKGYILAQAYVPEQKVINGAVAVRVLEGKLGHVLVEDNKMYGRRLLLKPFRGEIGQPVYKPGVESALLHLTDYPGLSIFGVFKPGSEVGTTDLVLKVKDEKRVNADFQMDNFGSKFTGKYRLRGDFSVNNLTGAADTVNGSVLQTFEPSNGIYGALSYERPLDNVRDSIGLGYSQNTYDIGGELAASGISGASEITNVFWRRSFRRAINFNSNGKLGLARKVATLSAPIGSTDKLAVLSAEFSFNSLSADFTKVNVGLIRFSQGIGGFLGAMAGSNDPTASRQGGSGEHAGGNFSKLEFRYDRVRRFTANQTVLATLSGQFSKDLLTSMEQMPLGGPTSVRGYPISEYLVDSGYFASLEWSVRAPGFAARPAFSHYTWGQLLQVAVFADVAGGTINDPLPTDHSSISISGVGAGLRFNSANFSGRLDVATPVTGVSGQNVKDLQAYINIIYKI
jgi:hemolysin activation/secretion protein